MPTPPSKHKQVLVLYYSQSGEVERCVERLTKPLAERDDVLIVRELLRPVTPFPSPWRSVRRFFDVLPECVLDRPPEIEEPAFAVTTRFDLVVLAYPVWFLAPALPVQSFFRCTHAAALKDASVVTLTVSRNMWTRASETMKSLLRGAGARHRDNIVATHQGPPWATFVSTPRALLLGKTNSLWGVFPAAGVGQSDLQRLEQLGKVLASKADQWKQCSSSMLEGRPALRVVRRYVIPEWIGQRLFRWWGRLIVRAGTWGSWARATTVYFFVAFLIGAIIVGLPIALLMMALIYPLIRPRLQNYVARLAEPTGVGAA